MSTEQAIWYEARVLHHARLGLLGRPSARPVSEVMLRGRAPHTVLVIRYLDRAGTTHETEWTIWGDEPDHYGTIESPAGLVGILVANWDEESS